MSNLRLVLNETAKGTRDPYLRHEAAQQLNEVQEARAAAYTGAYADTAYVAEQVAQRAQLETQHLGHQAVELAPVPAPEVQTTVPVVEIFPEASQTAAVEQASASGLDTDALLLDVYNIHDEKAA